MVATLYHVPPSFYSQVARLGLVEKGVDFESIYVMAGPPMCESYQPWYMRLNHGGTVPTLVVDGTSLPDSREILSQLDELFDGPRLIPEEPRERELVDEWVERAYDLPERLLAYGSPRLRRVGRWGNERRLAALRKQRRSAPTELTEAYDNKIHDIEDFLRGTADPELHRNLQKQLGAALDALDAHLLGREFVGAGYSIADVVWTITVGRSRMRGEAPLEGRPELTRWYRAMKQRPSFRKADVWERFRPQRLLPVLAAKLPAVLVVMALALLGLLGLLGWALIRSI